MQNWKNQYGLTFPVVADPQGTIYDLYGDGYVPYKVVIDRDFIMLYSDSSTNLNKVREKTEQGLNYPPKTPYNLQATEVDFTDATIQLTWEQYFEADLASFKIAWGTAPDNRPNIIEINDPTARQAQWSVPDDNVYYMGVKAYDKRAHSSEESIVIFLAVGDVTPPPTYTASPTPTETPTDTPTPTPTETPIPTETATPTDTPPPTNTPTATEIPTDTPIPTPTPTMPPPLRANAAIGGYWDTRLSTANEGLLTLVVLITNSFFPRAELYFNGVATGISLYDDGNHGDFGPADGVYGYQIPLPAGMPQWRLLFDVFVFGVDQSLHDQWPRLVVKP